MACFCNDDSIIPSFEITHFPNFLYISKFNSINYFISINIRINFLISLLKLLGLPLNIHGEDDWRDDIIISREFNIQVEEDSEDIEYTLVGVIYTKETTHFICRYLDLDNFRVFENDAMRNNGNSVLTDDNMSFPSFFERVDHTYRSRRYKAASVLYRKQIRNEISDLSHVPSSS